MGPSLKKSKLEIPTRKNVYDLVLSIDTCSLLEHDNHSYKATSSAMCGITIANLGFVFGNSSAAFMNPGIEAYIVASIFFMIFLKSGP